MKSLTASDIMNTRVLTAQEDMSVQELSDFFAENLISGAPVVNHEGKLAGVVSLFDIVRSDSRRVDIIKSRMKSGYYLHGWEDKLNSEEMSSFHVEANDGLTVKDIMTPAIFQVSEATPITEMADTMIGGRIHRLIVTRNEEVVGIVTTLDMLKAIRDLRDP